MGTQLGTNLCDGGSGPPPYDPDAAMLALAPFAWFRADTYTAAGAKVGAFVDRMNPANSCIQATDANRCVLPTSDAQLNGKPSVPFGAGIGLYASNLPSSAFKFMHDGSLPGFWYLLVFVQTNNATDIMCGTRNVGQPGCSIYYTTGTPCTGIIDDAGGIILNANTGSGLVTFTGSYADFSYADTGGSPEYFMYRQQVLMNSGVGVPGPTALAPVSTFTLGFNGSHRWADMIIFNRTPSVSDRTAARLYMTTKYGL